MSSENEYTSKDIKDNKGMAMLAYLIFFLPLIVAKDSKFAKYHANQGLIVLIVGIVGKIIFGLLSTLLSWLWSFAIIALIVIGIKNAYEGKAEELPIIGKYQILK